MVLKKINESLKNTKLQYMYNIHNNNLVDILWTIL